MSMKEESILKIYLKLYYSNTSKMNMKKLI